ncbi:MAG TPA: hypothetical protein VMG12_36635 [Polyangiaceae bacterium]|nr:hypothetical protein [Polyangiaceae bacterium]
MKTTHFQLSMTPIHTDAGWVGETREHAGSWRMASADGSRISFHLPVKPGDVITSLIMTINGGAGAGHGGATPAQTPWLELVRVSEAGDLETMIVAIGDPATGAEYDGVHTITVAGEYVVRAGRHVLRVTQERGANAVPGTTLLVSIGGTVERPSRPANHESVN